MEVTAKSITAKSLFKILFNSVGIGFFLLFVVFGIFALLGFETFKYNGEHVTGIFGLIGAIVSGSILAVLLPCLLWLVGVVGIFVNSLFGNLTIKFKDVQEDVV